MTNPSPLIAQLIDGQPRFSAEAIRALQDVPSGAQMLPDAQIVPVVPRHDGWTPARQRGFLECLALTGDVKFSAEMVGLSDRAPYYLRARADAEGFRAAWVVALEEARRLRVRMARG